MWRTTNQQHQLRRRNLISIHVLRVEDNKVEPKNFALLFISIHVLRVEDNPGGRRRAGCPQYFNPRPPCGGQPKDAYVLFGFINFNPRPPCGGQQTLVRSVFATRRFQSTSSVWRTTNLFFTVLLPRRISIHVLRVEGNSKNREKSLFAFI